MKQMDCYIVQDLLPLYIDHACSKQTAEDMEGHLQSCENCKKIYGEMRSEMHAALQAPEFDGRKIFRHAKKNVLIIILALAVVISCFVINAGGAWAGGSADISNLIVTVLYVIFWDIFFIRSRKYVPLIRISFAISGITFLSAAVGLIARMLQVGGFITGLLGIFSAIPFYGFRLFLDWSELYAIASALSLVWIIYTWHFKRQLAHTTDMKDRDGFSVE